MLAIFWSWTCVEKPELCGRGDKKQVRTLIFYLITCGCKLSLLWVLQPLYVKLVIWQDNLQIFWLDLTYTYLNLSNVLSLQIWPMNRWEITAQFVLLLSYYCTGHHSVNVYLYAGVVSTPLFAWPVKLLKTQRGKAKQVGWADCRAGWGWRSARDCKQFSRNQASKTPGLGSAEHTALWTPGGRKQHTEFKNKMMWDIITN